MKIRTCLTSILLATAICHAALGQGALTPPGPPGPGMKTLQEIYDRISLLETQSTTQEEKVEQLQLQNTALLENTGQTLPWKLSVIDTGGAGDVGKFPSMALNPVTLQPAVAYLDSTNDALKCAIYDGATWTVSTVDTGMEDIFNSYHFSLAFSPAGVINIAYHQATTSTLKLATRSGSSWNIVTVDDLGPSGFTGMFPCLAFDKQGRPAISFRAFVPSIYPGALRYANHNGIEWNFTFIDTAEESGNNTYLRFNPVTGYPVVYHVNGNDGIARLREFNGSSWVNTDLGTTYGYVRGIVFMPDSRPALVASGNPQLTVGQRAPESASFGFAPVDSATYFHASISATPTGRIAVTYQSLGTLNLRYAYSSGSSWVLDTVDFAGDVGESSALCINPNTGSPIISYYDKTNGNLKFAERGVNTTLVP
jgi:hypothetical protein